MSIFRKTNFNPWKQHIGDCAIRAISAGIGMSYVDVCKKFGVAYKAGKGLIRDTGIELEDIKKKFAAYFGNVTDMGEEVPPELADMALDVMKFDDAVGLDTYESGLTLAEFLDLYDGRFLVGLLTPDKSREGHITYANCDKKYFVDTFDCSNFIVDSWMEIRKTVPKDSPLHWKYDYEKH